MKKIDLYKCATSDFGFAKKKKNYHHHSTLLRRWYQIYRALLILMAHRGDSSRLRFSADNFLASYVYHQRNRLPLCDLTQHLNIFLHIRKFGGFISAILRSFHLKLK